MHPIWKSFQSPSDRCWESSPFSGISAVMSHAGTGLLCQERGGEGTREERVVKAVDRMEEGGRGVRSDRKKGTAEPTVSFLAAL